jgi:hypothetical protein
VKKDTFKATITTAHGNPLPKSVGDNGKLTISGEFDVYETVDDVRTAYAKPGEFDKFVIDSASAAAKASAVAQARTEALDAAGIKAPKMEESREMQIKSIMRGLVASGKSEEEARKVAETLV